MCCRTTSMIRSCSCGRWWGLGMDPMALQVRKYQSEPGPKGGA